MLNELSLKIIQNSGGQLKQPVRLVVFVKDASCTAVVELARAIKAQLGKITLEIYDIVMDRDKTEQYAIKRVPALVVQSGDNRMVTLYGQPENLSLELLLNAIRNVSEKKIWFPEEVRKLLQQLTHDVAIRVFIDANSQESKFVAETAIGLAFGSECIAVDIILAADFPDLVAKYRVSTLPKTLFGENQQLEGSILESDFLSMLFQAEGIRSGPDMKCLVCGKPSRNSICSNCTAKIEAEALQHKIQREKQKAPDTR